MNDENEPTSPPAGRPQEDPTRVDPGQSTDEEHLPDVGEPLGEECVFGSQKAHSESDHSECRESESVPSCTTETSDPALTIPIDESISVSESLSDEEAEPSDSSGQTDDITHLSARLSADVADQLAQQFSRIERRLEELARLGDRNADHVGALHAENQRLRSGEMQQVMSPLIRDVIRVYDDTVRLADNGSPGSDDLFLVSELLIGALGRWGVERLVPSIGDTFTTTIHSGVGRVASVDGVPSTVAAVRRCGFVTTDGRTLRTAEVEVYWNPEGEMSTPHESEEGLVATKSQELDQ